MITPSRLRWNGYAAPATQERTTDLLNEPLTAEELTALRIWVAGNMNIDIRSAREKVARLLDAVYPPDAPEGFTAREWAAVERYAEDRPWPDYAAEQTQKWAELEELRDEVARLKDGGSPSCPKCGWGSPPWVRWCKRDDQEWLEWQCRCGHIWTGPTKDQEAT